MFNSAFPHAHPSNSKWVNPLSSETGLDRIQDLQDFFLTSENYSTAKQKIQSLLPNLENWEKIEAVIQDLLSHLIPFCLQTRDPEISPQHSTSHPPTPQDSEIQPASSPQNLTPLPETPPKDSLNLSSQTYILDNVHDDLSQFWESAEYQEIMKNRRTQCQKVGQLLQQLRLFQGISEQTLHEQTFIPIHQIQQLEQGNLFAMKDDIYLRGFILRVSRVLKLEGQALLGQIPKPVVIPGKVRDRAQPIDLNLHPFHLYLGYTTLIASTLSTVAMNLPASTLPSSPLFSSPPFSRTYEPSIPTAPPTIAPPETDPLLLNPVEQFCDAIADPKEQQSPQKPKG